MKRTRGVKETGDGENNGNPKTTRVRERSERMVSKDSETQKRRGTIYHI